jgi:thioredoxin reductase (NADPH)
MVSSPPASANTPGGSDAPLIETDALVVGAGPVGLFLVFQLGLLEVQAQVVDSLPCAGGQPTALYPDKPIYDIPAIPVCTGQGLTEALLEQIRPFGATLHLGQTLTELAQQADGRFLAQSSQGTRFLAKTVFIAAGVGAFLPRTLGVEGLSRFEGKQLHHHVLEPERFAGKDLVIVGGTDAALDWALKFTDEGPTQARSVTLIHRRDGFQAEAATIERVRERRAQQRLHFMAGQVTGLQETGGVMVSLQVATPEATTRDVPLDALLVLQGLSPKLGPISDWGLALERKQLMVDTETFSTNVPGIFAVGDITNACLPPTDRCLLSFPKKEFCCNTPPRARGCTNCSAWHPHPPFRSSLREFEATLENHSKRRYNLRLFPDSSVGRATDC